MRSMKLIALAAALSLAACSDDSKPTPDGPSIKKDTGTTTGSDAPLPTTSLLQTVANKFTLPATATEYAYDYDGTGAKNKLGTLIQVLASAGFPLQQKLDETVTAGGFLLLMDVLGKSLTDDANIAVKANLGAAKGGAVSDAGLVAPNFTGAGEFTPNPPDLSLTGKIAAGKLTATGNLIIPMPVGDDPSKYPQVGLQKGRLTATVADSATSAMTAGVINGVIPWTDVDQKIIPAIQASVDKAYKDPTTTPATRALMKSLFDTNGDGNITVDEIRNSAALKLVLAPDVDTDGNGTSDAMSVGLAFTAVKAKIVK